MAGKIDEDGTTRTSARLELVASTEIWMGSFHVADVRSEVGRGSRLASLEALLENASGDMIHEAAHVEELDELRNDLVLRIRGAEKQSEYLQHQLEEADNRTEHAEARVKDLCEKGPAQTILSLMDQVATLTQEAVHSAAALSKARADIRQLQSVKTRKK